MAVFPNNFDSYLKYLAIQKLQMFAIYLAPTKTKIIFKESEYKLDWLYHNFAYVYWHRIYELPVVRKIWLCMHNLIQFIRPLILIYAQIEFNHTDIFRWEQKEIVHEKIKECFLLNSLKYTFNKFKTKSSGSFFVCVYYVMHNSA